ncbi:MAG: hypothetical protein LBG65_01965 [Puniceicoccales bacterium]|jgi:hypothetical protein|nr:hypothetical protein [Puniceicoccales bacterium]
MAEKTRKTAEIATFATADLAQSGHGAVLVAVPAGKTRARLATFVVDTQCLGIRKVTLSELPLPTLLNQGLAALHAIPVAPSMARSIVEGSAAYAKKLGFPPPSNYAAAIAYFGETPAAPAAPFQFGKNGSPHYAQQPGDSDEFAENVIQKLNLKLGPKNFTYELEATAEQWVDGEEAEDSGEFGDSGGEDGEE